MTRTAPSLDPAYRFLNRELSVDDFERWLYSTPALEETWGATTYLELISIDYRSKRAEHEARKALDTLIDFAAFELWRLVPLLNTIAAGGQEGQAALAATYDEYCNGYAFLDNLAFGWGLTEHIQLTSADAGQADWQPPPAAIEEAERALEWLRTGDVVLTGERDELGNAATRTIAPRRSASPGPISVRERQSFVRALAPRLTTAQLASASNPPEQPHPTTHRPTKRRSRSCGR